VSFIIPIIVTLIILASATFALLPSEPEIKWLGHPMFVLPEDVDDSQGDMYVISDLVCGVADSNSENWDFVMVCKEVDSEEDTKQGEDALAKNDNS
jgi:hypothetical protein